MKNLLILILCSFFTTSVLATTITWNGGSGKWITASNWTPAQVPGPGDDVIIPSGSDEVLIKTGNYTIASLYISTSSADLVIYEGASLTIANSSRNIIMESRGEVHVYGTLQILGHDPGNSSPTALYMRRTLHIYPSGQLNIEDIDGIGLHTYGYTDSVNEGEIFITNVSEMGIYADMDFENYGDIFIEDCGDFGLYNKENFINAGNLRITDTDDTAIRNEGDILNTGVIKPIQSGHYAFYNKSGASIDNYESGYIACSGSGALYDLYNQGTFINRDCGEVVIKNKIKVTSSGLFQNQALLRCSYNGNHSNSGTMENDGLIHDPYEAFEHADVDNDGIIVIPFEGPVYVNEQVHDALGLGSTSGFYIGKWFDPTIEFKVGTYQNWGNRFTPNSSSVGLTEILVNISDDAGCFDKNFSIRIPGGIQPEQGPAPLVMPDSGADTQDDYLVYPNPAGDHLNVGIPTQRTSTPLMIQFFNSTGELILHQETVDIPVTRLDLQDLPTGMYLVQIQDSTGTLAQQKVIVE